MMLHEACGQLDQRVGTIVPLPKQFKHRWSPMPAHMGQRQGNWASLAARAGAQLMICLPAVIRRYGFAHSSIIATSWIRGMFLRRQARDTFADATVSLAATVASSTGHHQPFLHHQLSFRSRDLQDFGAKVSGLDLSLVDNHAHNSKRGRAHCHSSTTNDRNCSTQRACRPGGRAS